MVVIGGGFGGLCAARALRRTDADVTLVDRRNHHVFQPLLYQVATAALSPAQIAAPIRRVLTRQKNTRVILGEVTGVDTTRRRVTLSDGELEYDYLIIAAGVTHSYFGSEQWASLAPGLKTIDDATEIRRRFLLAFEAAERESDEAARRAWLTFVVVGGGPTGVELAGAFAEIARKTIAGDFRNINTAETRVVLVEAGSRVLGAYPDNLSARAQRDLESLGVEVRVASRVTEIDDRGVVVTSAAAPAVGGVAGATKIQERIDARCVLWAAGVKASPLGASLGVPLDRSGRVVVSEDLSAPGSPNVFVIGDLASVKREGSEHPVPGVAPAAMQMGWYAGGLIAQEIRAAGSGGSAAPRKAFEYVNKGELATIGRARAVGVLGFGLGMQLTGFIAWALWAMIHISYLIGFRNRILVMIDWAWSYVFFSRGARLITGDSMLRLLRSRERAEEFTTETR